MQVRAVPTYHDIITLSWTDNLGTVDHPKLRRLDDALTHVHGVESVVMSRYSARLVIATHVVRLWEVELAPAFRAALQCPIDMVADFRAPTPDDPTQPGLFDR